MFKKAKKLINSYLIKIAKQNNSQFGKGPMDCCKLNRNDKR